MSELAVYAEEAALGEVRLTPELRERVWYTKYESQDPMITDTQHGDVWNQQLVANSRLGFTEEMGCIVDMVGTRRGTVGITAEGDVLSEEQVDNRETTTGRNVRRFMAYDFRVSRVVKTDGPLRKENLMRTYEQQRMEGEKEMFHSIADAFTQAMSKSQVSPSPLITDEMVQDFIDRKSIAGEQELVLEGAAAVAAELVDAAPVTGKSKKKG